MMRDDYRAPNAGLVDGHGWVIPTQEMRRDVVRAAAAAGMSVDQWLTRCVHDRLRSVGLVREAIAIDDDRVRAHVAMVRGMARD